METKQDTEREVSIPFEYLSEAEMAEHPYNMEPNHVLYNIIYIYIYYIIYIYYYIYGFRVQGLDIIHPINPKAWKYRLGDAIPKILSKP